MEKHYHHLSTTDRVTLMFLKRQGHRSTWIIASLESEMTVKELHLSPPPVYLLPRNPAYQPILIEEGMVLEIFGVVTNVVRSLKRGRRS